MALNIVKHTYEEDLESIKLDHHKSKSLIPDSSSIKVINLDSNDSSKPQLRKEGESKQSRSQLNMKPSKHARQD